MIYLFPLRSYIKLAYSVSAFWQLLLKIKHALFFFWTEVAQVMGKVCLGK